MYFRTVKTKVKTAIASIDKLGKLTSSMKLALKSAQTTEEVEHLVSV